jgi:hypothetical protein
VPKQGEIALRLAWPQDTVFRRLALDVESDSCEHGGATLGVFGVVVRSCLQKVGGGSSALVSSRAKLDSGS